MLYENDLMELVSKWEEKASLISYPQFYRDGLGECAHELKTLIEKNFEEEALAQESFKLQMKEDYKCWEQYFNNLTSNGIFA